MASSGVGALAEARAHPRLFRAEAEFFLVDALHLDLADRFQAERQLVAQPRVFEADVPAKALNDGDFVGLDRVKNRQQNTESDQYQDADNDQSLWGTGDVAVKRQLAIQTVIVSPHVDVSFSSRCRTGSGAAIVVPCPKGGAPQMVSLGLASFERAEYTGKCSGWHGGRASGCGPAC